MYPSLYVTNIFHTVKMPWDPHMFVKCLQMLRMADADSILNMNAEAQAKGKKYRHDKVSIYNSAGPIFPSHWIITLPNVWCMYIKHRHLKVYILDCLWTQAAYSSTHC